jgi:sugar phosphate isomerase/epimerase
MKNTIRFGIIQGRLTQSPPNCLQWFPENSWEKEFRSAEKLGIDFIELIVDTKYNPKNPIWSDSGRSKIRKLIKDNNLTNHALCNDFTIENSLLDEKVLEQNILVLNHCRDLGIEKYIIPLFNKSEINSSNMNNFIEPIKIIAKAAKNNNMSTCLETCLSGKDNLKFLKLINLPFVKVVYDLGNQVACGHDLPSDIRQLGNHIGHVHIKDKNLNDENTLLGTGLVHFEQVFTAFKDINYEGPFTFETVRGSDPIKTAMYNLQLVKFFLGNANPDV